MSGEINKRKSPSAECEARAEYYQLHKEAIKAGNKRYRERNKEKVNAKQREMYQRDKEKIKARNLKNRAHNTDVNRIWRHKKFAHTRPMPDICEICNEKETAKRTTESRPFSLSYDHCHNTGEFRGWLCGRCNLTLGRCKDNANLLRNMAQYLDNHKQQLEAR